MARISTYINDTTLNDEDLLTGSNFIRVGEYNTRNYKLVDLAEYFANFQISDNQLYNFATISQQVTTNVSNISSNATFSTNLAASFGTTNASGTLTSLSQSFADQVFTTTASNRFATTTSVNTLTSTVEGKPDIFRQDDAPATTNPVGSIWYDTNDNNKVYVLLSGTPNVWTLTSDDRIVTNSTSISNVSQSVTTLSNSLGAEAALIDELQTQFTFDLNGGITGTADALATSISTASSTAAGAVATDLDKLETQFTFDSNGDVNGVAGALNTSISTAQSNAETASAALVTKLQSNIGTFDALGNLTSLSTSFANSVMNTENTTDYAQASNLNTLSAVLGIDSTDGSQSTQATAIVNGATNTTTTSIVDGDVDSSEDLVITADNSNIEVGQFLTGSYVSTASSVRVKAVSGTSVTLDKKISILDAETVTFTGTATVSIDNVLGTIRPGLVVKGTGLTVGTSVASISGTTLTLSKAESLADNTALTFLGIYAAVDQTAEAIANIDGTISASYGLKVDANGNIASMNFFADDTSSEVSFLADSFKVYNGASAVAPFEVVNNVVKIKSANIGTVSFGDLSNVPTTFVSTVIYADDASGTNASTTKGASQNFFAINQAASAWADGDSVTGLVFAQITGDTGATGATGAAGADGADGAQGPQGLQGVAGTNGTDGADGANGADGADGQDGTNGVDGRRTSTGILWYYQGQSTTPAAPSDITAGYRFSDGTFNSTSASTLPTNWVYESPLMYAGTASNQYWTVAYTAIETSAGSGYGTVTFASAAVRAFAFNQVVTFNSLSTSGSTTINGDNITTGQIQSSNYGSVSGNYSTAGSIINLTNGNIYTPNFSIIGGAARFKGDITGASGTFTGNIQVTGTALVQGSVSSGDFIAAKFKNTDTTNNAGAGISLNSSSDYHHRILMTGGTTTNINGASSFDLNASYQLGEDGQYSKQIIKLNGAGLIIPNQTANGVTASANYSGGMNIIFNENNGARTASSGRMHLNEYMRTFFIDVPEAPRTDGDYANMSFVIRKFVTASPTNYESAMVWVKSSTNSLHVKGDIVASESSDRRLKDNIKPIQNAVEKINKIGGYEFDWNDNQELYEGHDVGVIAQEIEKVLPEVVETREDGYKAVDYKKIVPLLIEGIKDLQKQIDELKNK